MKQTISNLSFLIFLVSSVTLFSQENNKLYMSKEFQRAYQNKTRSLKGTPGENYFINRIDYDIKVNFNPDTRLIKGSESISYTNNSTDTLEFLYLNLYMDLLKKGNMRDWDFGNTADLTNGVNLSNLKINNIKLEDKNYHSRSSILRIKLKEAFLPNTTHKISLDWNYISPGEVTVRSGQYGDKNFFIAYWFPKVAVYDDIVGWNTRGHSGIQEFYNDFGNYNVEISVPGDYRVWSTAILQNPKDLFQKKFLDRIKESKESDNIIHIVSKEDIEKGKILKKEKQKVWKFKSENTPDFAFAVSKSYLWDATSVISAGKRISINTVYKEDSRDFKDAVQISKDIIRFFTDSTPGIPYPYSQFTAFNGGGGMEFPGMVNNGDSYALDATKYLMAHELGHSYFPFYTGLNEQKYAWMDEGLITFFPKIFVLKTIIDTSYSLEKRSVEGYNKTAGTFLDVPLMIPSDNLSRVAYRTQAYTRSSTAFFELYRLIGEDKFSESLQPIY